MMRISSPLPPPGPLPAGSIRPGWGTYQRAYEASA